MTRTVFCHTHVLDFACSLSWCKIRPIVTQNCALSGLLHLRGIRGEDQIRRETYSRPARRDRKWNPRLPYLFAPSFRKNPMKCMQFPRHLNFSKSTKKLPWGERNCAWMYTKRTYQQLCHWYQSYRNSPTYFHDSLRVKLINASIEKTNIPETLLSFSKLICDSGPSLYLSPDKPRRAEKTIKGELILSFGRRRVCLDRG